MGVFNKLFLLLIVYVSTALGQTQSNSLLLRTKHFNIEKEALAIQGYDVVSYFLNSPQKGNKSYSYNYKGITYLFSSAKNLDSFKTNPDKYEPTYGGWCAYAMGKNGEKVEVDPETFKIINNKLYLFYNFYFNNTLKTWNKDEINLKKAADSNWIKTYK